MAAGAERHRGHASGMAFQRNDFSDRFQVPHLDPVIVASAREAPAIGADCYACNLVRVASVCSHQSSARYLPGFDRPIITSAQDDFFIWRERNCVNIRRMPRACVGLFVLDEIPEAQGFVVADRR